MEWEPNYEENISAYLIYRAEYFDENDSLGEFELRYRLEIELNTPTEFVDTEIEMRTSYYYKLKSNDISDNSSTFSDSLRYILLPQIPFNRMSPNGYTDSLSPLRSLNWVYSSSIELEDYCITILAQNNDLIIRMIQSPSSYVGWRESWEIPSYISLQHNNIYKWRVDMNARYINSMETAGSESAWATFLYVGD